MSEYTAKNYTEQGGDITHIGGTLIIEEGANVEGLPRGGGSEYELPVASDTTLGGIKVGGGLDITASGVMSVDSDDIDLPLASISSPGVVKPGDCLAVDGSGTISFSGLEYEVIVVSGTTTGRDVFVSIPFDRSDLSRCYFSGRSKKYFVRYEDENTTKYFYAYMVGIGQGADHYAYFRGFKGLTGAAPKEYIIGIDYRDAGNPEDFVYVQDLALT